MPTIGGALSGTIDLSGITTQIGKIELASIVSANTEYSHTFANGTKSFVLQNRNEGLVKISFTSGQSGTTYWSIFPGQQFPSELLDGSGITIYFQSPKSAQTLEMVSWS